MTSVMVWPPPPEDRPGDGIVKLRTGEYRIHKAWSDRPHVFVRYLSSKGRLAERKLTRYGATAQKVVAKFRDETQTH
jgi:hypothetical protein